MKKVLKIFKSKFILVPVVAVGLVAAGAGIGFLTYKDQPAVASSGPTYVKTLPGLFKGSSHSGDILGASTSDTTTSPSSSTPSSPSSTQNQAQRHSQAHQMARLLAPTQLQLVILINNQ